MITRILNKQVSKFCGKRMNTNTAIFREKSLMDDFYTEKTISSVDGTDVVRYVDPIHTLLNQKRLESLGLDSMNTLIKQINDNLGHTDQLQQLRSHVSDDDLLATIKSRHINNLTDLHQWSKYMTSSKDKFSQRINDAVQKMKSEQTDNENVEQ